MSVPKWHLPIKPSLEASYLYEKGLYSESDASKVATMLGVRLVSQVLQEACTVVTATQRIGWPWTSVLSIYKDLKAGKVTVPERDAFFEYLQGDNEPVHETTDHANVVATSTPHKGDCTKMKHENNLRGQGDAEIDMSQNELDLSTTQYINQLFDMTVVSDVDVANTEDEVEVANTEIMTPDDYTLLGMNDIMNKIFQRVVNVTIENEVKITEIPFEEKESEEEIINVHEPNWGAKREITEFEEIDMKQKICEVHCAFIQEACDTCGLETVKCFIDSDDEESMDGYEQITNYANVDVHKESEEYDFAVAEPIIPAKSDEYEKEGKSDVARYENAYLSLNRDYEQCSDDGDPVLQDPKEPMQEVELSPAADDNNISICQEEESKKRLAAISAVSAGATSSRKSRSSLVSRCKTQGARLLSCLRGWWCRKTPGKRREARHQGSIQNVCPLSPDARRRAVSMLDQRELCSPHASRSGTWKFNTVNEGIVQSMRWKEYTYELAARPEFQ